jgi:hypothetical protein
MGAPGNASTAVRSLLAGAGGFSVAIMSSDSDGEDLISEVFASVAAAYGPGMARLVNLFAELIARRIQTTADQDSAVGTYVRPGERKSTSLLPPLSTRPNFTSHCRASSWSGCCRWHPAWGGAVHVVWPTSMR